MGRLLAGLMAAMAVLSHSTRAEAAAARDEAAATARTGLGQGIEAVTRPSGDVALAFVRPGRVTEVLVKEGDAVKAGDALMHQDNEAERLVVARLKAAADDTARLRAADAQLARRRDDLVRIEAAAKEGGATEWELDHARLGVRVAELALRTEQFKRQQYARQHQEAETELARMTLRSPIDGRVEALLVEAGETAKAAAPVVRVVRVNPLWVDAAVPLAQALDLKVGGAATLEFPPPAGGRVEGKILHVAAVADPASATLRVRIEVPNAAGRAAGETVKVHFTAAGAP
jgi:RND family efflux transporter MFP subunit